jgi:hypothetical protein
MCYLAVKMQGIIQRTKKRGWNTRGKNEGKTEKTEKRRVGKKEEERKSEESLQAGSVGVQKVI